MFCRKDVLKNFAKFIGKDLRQSLFLIKKERTATSLQKRPRHKCFSVNFLKLLRTHLLIDHPWCLLMTIFPIAASVRTCLVFVVKALLLNKKTRTTICCYELHNETIICEPQRSFLLKTPNIAMSLEYFNQILGYFGR